MSTTPKTYQEAKEAELSTVVEVMSAAVTTSGTCNIAVIDDIVDWVVRRDPDASEKFGRAVRGGQAPYFALKDRLGHDRNALGLITRCEVEARQALANRGYP